VSRLKGGRRGAQGEVWKRSEKTVKEIMLNRGVQRRSDIDRDWFSNSPLSVESGKEQVFIGKPGNSSSSTIRTQSKRQRKR
jgi:hypothetical protein